MEVNTAGWPHLDYAEYGPSLSTLHMFTQIVGKIRLVNTPWINHQWHVSLYITARGLSTGSIPYRDGCFDIEFDFTAHQLILRASHGGLLQTDLTNICVADFYKSLIDNLKQLGVPVNIYAKPNEVDPAVPFADDNLNCTYNGAAINKLWQAMVKVNNVFVRFRAGYIGKCSPVHFFWGAFDLAVTRFSGREAPLHSGDAPNMPVRVMQEAYSHEVSSCGFWPGNKDAPQPIFYAYCYPAPAAFSMQQVQPAEAFYNNALGEFILPYDAVSQSNAPEKVLLKFLQSTYVAAAETGNWDRRKLECDLTYLEAQTN